MKMSCRGNMSFAMVAVLILLLSAAMTGLTARYRDSSDMIASMEEEIARIESAEDGMRHHIERGLGSILLELSLDDDMGDLDERGDTFQQKLSEWMSFNMPLTDHGIRGHLVGYDVDLSVRSLSAGGIEEGVTPAYLESTGEVRLRLEGTGTSRIVSLDITSDGTYGLPLLCERASLFESMTEGVSLYNMISYQLTSLAEYRILNGYGSSSKYGDNGTTSILTSDDVLTAYRNALGAISLICFRSDGGYLSDGDRIDLAELLVVDGEYAVLDLSSLYAQALYSKLDSIALSWFEYFCGDRVISSMMDDQASMKRLSDMIVSFLKGESVNGAESYIKEVMESNGHEYDDYSRPGRGTTLVEYGGYSICVENPTLNLMDQTWITHFKSDYYRDKGYLMGFIRSTLYEAVTLIASNKDMGAVKLPIDPNDGLSFSESMVECVSDALNASTDIVISAFQTSLSSSPTTDPFYGAIADTIRSHNEDFILEEEFLQRVVYALAEVSEEPVDTEALVSSEEVSRALHSYRKAVLEDLSVFEELRSVPGGQPGIIKKIAAYVLKDRVSFVDMIHPIEKRIISMCEELARELSVNPCGDVLELPDSNMFELTTDDMVSYERIDALLESDPVCIEPFIIEEACEHTIGFNEDDISAYTTVFRIRLYDNISYSLLGGNTLSDALGRDTSKVSGMIALKLEMDIHAFSGWALSGISYIPSTTIIDDSIIAFLNVIEPVIEPLCNILGMMEDVLSFLIENIMEVISYVSQAIMTVYDQLMAPVEILNGWITSQVDRLVSDSVLSILMSVNLGKQYVELGFHGYVLKISTSALTWVDKTKTLFSVVLTGPVAGYTVSAGITVKAKGDVKSENIVVTGNGSIKSEDWSIKMTMDPLMKSSRHLLTIDGEYKDTEVSIVLPELVKYHETGIALSEVPGLGSQLSCIPVPGLGVNVGLDAGFSLRLSEPVKEGLVINEFESNPPGDDHGMEAIELFNNSNTSIDLDGYTLHACSDRKNKVMTLSGSIAPGEILVVTPTFTLVNQSGKYTKNGEAVLLKDPDGNEVDKTPTKKDSDNDNKTIQRKFDGSTEWVFEKSTIGSSNGSGLADELLTVEDVKSIVWHGVQKGFEDVGSITDVDSLARFIQSLVYNTVDRAIDHVCGRIVEASAYVCVDISDMTSSASGRIRLALRTDSELASDTLKLIAGKIQALVFGIKDPYNIDAESVIPNNVDLEVCVGARLGFPKLLSKTGDMPEVVGDVVFRANLSSISRLLGSDVGRPQVDCGIRFMDVPYEVIPSIMKPNKKLSNDVWLFRLTVTWA